MGLVVCKTNQRTTKSSLYRMHGLCSAIFVVEGGAFFRTIQRVVRRRHYRCHHRRQSVGYLWGRSGQSRCQCSTCVCWCWWWSKNWHLHRDPSENAHTHTHTRRNAYYAFWLWQHIMRYTPTKMHKLRTHLCIHKLEARLWDMRVCMRVCM